MTELTPALPGARRAVNPSAVLAVLCLASFMASLDVFVVNVAFPDIGRDFREASLSSLSWILNGYAIVYAALLIPLGRLADRYGRKTVFLSGVALFTLGSAACAASPNLWSLIAFRGAQAVGAAALTPTSLGLLLNATPVERRAKAVKIWAVSAALAAAVGPVVGGLLVQAAWQWVFIINLPVGVLAFVATVRTVPDSRDGAASPVPDIVGAATIAMSVGALALTLVKGPDWGWTSRPTVGAAALAVAAALFFARRIGTHDAPVIEPALLRVRTFAWSNLAVVGFNTAFGASLLAFILWMQGVWHESPVVNGLAIAPGPLAATTFTAVGHRLGQRFRVGTIAAAGSAIVAAGNVLLLLSVGAQPHYATEVLPGWLLVGAGVGLAFPTLISAATADLPPARTATGSAVVTMSRQIGFVLGVSVIVAVLGAPGDFAHTHAAFVNGWRVISGIALVSALAALGASPRRPTGASVVDASAVDEADAFAIVDLAGAAD